MGLFRTGKMKFIPVSWTGSLGYWGPRNKLFSPFKTSPDWIYKEILPDWEDLWLACCAVGGAMGTPIMVAINLPNVMAELPRINCNRLATVWTFWEEKKLEKVIFMVSGKEDFFQVTRNAFFPITNSTMAPDSTDSSVETGLVSVTTGPCAGIPDGWGGWVKTVWVVPCWFIGTGVGMTWGLWLWTGKLWDETGWLNGTLGGIFICWSVSGMPGGVSCYSTKCYNFRPCSKWKFLTWFIEADPARFIVKATKSPSPKFCFIFALIWFQGSRILTQIFYIKSGLWRANQTQKYP